MPHFGSTGSSNTQRDQGLDKQAMTARILRVLDDTLITLHRSRSALEPWRATEYSTLFKTFDSPHFFLSLGVIANPVSPMLPKSRIPPRHLNSLAPILSAVLRMSVASTGVRPHGSATSPGRQPCVTHSLRTARARYHFFRSSLQFAQEALARGNSEKQKNKK